MIIDIIFIAAFVLCIFSGAKKGFARTVVGLFSYIVSCIIGFVLFDRFYEYICNYEPTAVIIGKIRSNISDGFLKYVTKNQPDLPVFMKNGVNDFNSSVAGSISETGTKTVVGILFILFVIVAIKLLTKAIMLMVKLPVLKQFNGIMGAAIGAVNGIIVCYIFGAIFIFMLLSSGNEHIIKELDTSVIGTYFYKNNIILNMLLGFNK